MFSDDFWSELDPTKKPIQITVRGFFTRIAAAVRTIFNAKHAPDYAFHDALGDQVALPEELSKGTHRTGNWISAR
jgi:hypothetical protein